MKNKILLVVSNYYEEISNNLIKGSTDALKDKNFESEVIFSPGCFEIPLILKKNINNYMGFIALGCVIRGETYHFEIISNLCSMKIMDLSIQNEKPIGFGILTCNNIQQALVRSDPKQKNKGKEAALACIKLL